MDAINRTYCMLMLVVFLCIVGTHGVAQGTLLTLDGVGDAGVNPGQAPYLKFVENANTNNILYDADPAFFMTNPNPWTSATQVFAFAANQSPANWNTDWLLASAGNYWSPDTVVGETLAGLQAGTYRITSLAGAFTYDSFNWSPQNDQWRWGMNIRVHGGYINGQINDYDCTLGSFDPNQLSSDLGRYLDIRLAEGGSLSFWINDWNTIDNGGSLTFSVAPVPEPSTFLLLGVGLTLLIWRKRCNSKRSCA